MSSTSTAMPSDGQTVALAGFVNIGPKAFVITLATGLVAFGVQIFIFEFLRSRTGEIMRFYAPKTYLVTEAEQTRPPSPRPFGWLWSIFSYGDREIMSKCGLDAYFFLRYLQTLLLIFVPIALLVLPILIPINRANGNGTNPKPDALVSGNTTFTNPSYNITGFDSLAWGNVSVYHTQRYWAHLILCVIVISWVFIVIFWELKVYIRIRQDYLTSASHRLRASANTVLVTAIPGKWLTQTALRGLYDVFPGGIRNVWINRKYDELYEFVEERRKLRDKLEDAETELIKECVRKKQKMDEGEVKKAGIKISRLTKAEKRLKAEADEAEANRRAREEQGTHVGRDGNESSEEVEKRDDESVDDPQDMTPAKDSSASPTSMKAEARSQGFSSNNDRTLSPPKKGIQSSQPSPTAPSFRSENVDTRPAGSMDSLRYRSKEGAKKEFRDVGPTTEDSPWWKFWRPPGGGYPSPLPHTDEGDEFPLEATDDPSTEKTFAAKLRSALHIGKHVEEDAEKGPVDVKKESIPKPENYYREQYATDYARFVTNRQDAAWKRYMPLKKRPMMRIRTRTWYPAWMSWLATIFFLETKVDTIIYCRGMLACLNAQIKYGQTEGKYPLMNSAFIQFNYQVAAHMAAQAVSHHVPKQMAPRTVEVNPKDVIWGNMSIKWWEAWVRTGAVIAIVTGMIILWAIPVAATALLSNLPALIEQYPFLSGLSTNDTLRNFFTLIGGVLPAIAIMILLILPPIIFRILARVQGAQTGSQVEKSVQNYMFFFNFVQIFLVVSIASGAIQTIGAIASNPSSIPATLATNVPSAANYFFQYLLLQALSNSAGNLLNATAIGFYYFRKWRWNTARKKWLLLNTKQTTQWGTYFPQFTNFACIGLIYSIMSPLILVFVCLTFSLFWVANRYSMLYVIRAENDTGGLLYPQALNQLFTGVYVLELCMIGLFILVQGVDTPTDAESRTTCIPQAIIMVVMLAFTIIYQVLLNASFGPLYEYLPITFEDEAVLRDEQFEREQKARFASLKHEPVEHKGLLQRDEQEGHSIEMDNLTPTTTQAEEGHPGHKEKKTRNAFQRFAHGGVNLAQRGLGLATEGLTTVNKATLGFVVDKENDFRRQIREKRQRDLEANDRFHAKLYEFPDEIEDFTPEERQALVDVAFHHEALREREPVIWIPHDDLGVADDEIRDARELRDEDGRVRVSYDTRGTALNARGKVFFQVNPPDFKPNENIRL